MIRMLPSAARPCPCFRFWFLIPRSAVSICSGRCRPKKPAGTAARCALASMRASTAKVSVRGLNGARIPGIPRSRSGYPPEMREAPTLPGPPRRVRVLHPSSVSLPSNDRLLPNPPRPPKGHVSSPFRCLLPTENGVNRKSTKYGASPELGAQPLELQRLSIEEERSTRESSLPRSGHGVSQVPEIVGLMAEKGRSGAIETSRSRTRSPFSSRAGP